MQSRFLFYLAQCAGFDGLVGFLFPLGQVPQVVPADEQVLACAIADQSAAGGYFEKMGAEFREIGIIHRDAFLSEVNVLHFFAIFVAERMQN